MTQWMKLLFASAFLIFGQCIKAQTVQNVDEKSVSIRKDSGLYIYLNGGSSIPMGYFKSPTYLGLGGYANNGYGGNIGLENPFKSGWIGLTFEMGYYVYPLNLSAYKNIMNPYLLPFSYAYYGATPYKETPILLGIFFEKIFNRFTFEFKSMAGFETISVSHVNAVDTSHVGCTCDPHFVPGSLQFMENNPISQIKTIYTFIYSFEISIRYTLMNHLSIRGNAGYLNNIINKPILSEWDVPVSQLHFGIGMAYHF